MEIATGPIVPVATISKDALEIGSVRKSPQKGEDCCEYTLFYKEPTSRPSSKSSLFVDIKSANCSTKSSLIVP